MTVFFSVFTYFQLGRIFQEKERHEKYFTQLGNIFKNSSQIFQEGFFNFLQEHLRFSRTTYPQEQLILIIDRINTSNWDIMCMR